MQIILNVHIYSTCWAAVHLPIVAEIKVEHDNSEHDDLQQELFEGRRWNDGGEGLLDGRGGRRCHITGGRRSSDAVAGRCQRVRRGSAVDTCVYSHCSHSMCSRASSSSSSSLFFWFILGLLVFRYSVLPLILIL